MATAIMKQLFPASGDAAWSAFCQEIYDMLIGIGLVDTGDTGSAGSTVSTTYPSANTTPVWWVFRFDDPMQATAPIFMKLEFGRGNTAGTNLYAAATIGTGTNGSGTITGALTARLINSSGAIWSTSATTTVVYEACYNEATGTFWFLQDSSNAPPGFFTFVTRSIDAGGVPTDEAILTITHPYNSIETMVVRDVAGAVNRTLTGVFDHPYTLAGAAGNSITNATDGKWYLNPLYAHLVAGRVRFNGAYGQVRAVSVHGHEWTLNEFGTAIRYKTVGSGTSMVSGYDFGSAGSGLMCVWE